MKYFLFFLLLGTICHAQTKTFADIGSVTSATMTLQNSITANTANISSLNTLLLQLTTKVNVLSATVASLTTTTSSGTTSSGSSTTTSSSTYVASGYNFPRADSTIGRVNLSTMTSVTLTTTADFVAALGQAQTNKHIYVTPNVVVDGYTEQTGALNNVLFEGLGNAFVAGAGNSVRFTNSTGSTNLRFQGNATRQNWAFVNFRFENTYSQSDESGLYPILHSNELPLHNGGEIYHCYFTGPNVNTDAIGFFQYSTGSNQGKVASNIFIHGNKAENLGRMFLEVLSQGYDGVERIINWTVTNNTVTNTGTVNSLYGQIVSFSGLGQRIYDGKNISDGHKDMAHEIANCHYAVVEDNIVTGNKTNSNGLTSIGISISDDRGTFSTKGISIKGNSINVGGRALQVYNADSVYINGKNNNWVSHRQVDTSNMNHALWENVYITIWSTNSGGESGLQIAGGGSNNVIRNSTFTSGGATAAGYYPSWEQVVIRSGCNYNTLTGITTILGRLSNGSTFAPSGGGSLGEIVNQGSNNTLSNNTNSVVN